MTSYNINECIQPLGDSALVIRLGSEIHPSTHQKVKNLSLLLEKNSFTGFIEAVPSYTTLTVYYNPIEVFQSRTASNSKSPYKIVSEHVFHLLKNLRIEDIKKQRIVKIPVVYGGDFGPDLDYVANYNQLTREEVIHIHSANEYLVYMIGFAPGFPFMGGMDERIATPRKDSPRLAIHPGSVGIAGKQTGVYPLETPGGWQIIGRTPLALFLPPSSPPTLLQAGDRIRFVPISEKEFEEYKELKS
ncbi:5-oxoprolinase subunit PxpB [Lysinibacillus yapensis]|uniref:5-oxoprolinase subunit PxpB n=1 Tax=Ureibacillus yapensis TaxID=2304605 RepID=A0A396S926_9BACL|nr:5-oxoprolinase subunit PxpB [Lysinibacillus yapensis]RHW37592.1 5-oxoprolinase subunit PxpB [Lysinibacillus yapensis]